MLYRLSPIAPFAIAAWALVWNAWFRPSPMATPWSARPTCALFSVAVLIATLLVILLPAYRPQDRHWGYATLGMLIGFWMQR